MAPAVAAPPAYLVTGSLCGVREWRRRDRSTLETWPAVQLPAHWRSVEPVAGERHSYAIDALPAPALIGRISLREVDHEQARLGIYLRPDYVGRGYGTAALAVFQRWVFRSLGLAALVLDVAADNRRAIACYQRAGWQTTASVSRGGHTYLEMVVRP